MAPMQHAQLHAPSALMSYIYMYMYNVSDCVHFVTQVNGATKCIYMYIHIVHVHVLV